MEKMANQNIEDINKIIQQLGLFAKDKTEHSLIDFVAKNRVLAHLTQIGPSNEEMREQQRRKLESTHQKEKQIRETRMGTVTVESYHNQDLDQEEDLVNDFQIFGDLYGARKSVTSPHLMRSMDARPMSGREAD
jgi:hypothetical protein